MWIHVYLSWDLLDSNIDSTAKLLIYVEGHKLVIYFL